MSGGAGVGPDLGWRPGQAPAPVESIAGFTDLVEIGRGGDSVVYRARQAAMGRDVAVKVLLVDDPDRRARFEREVQITVELGRQHPNIVNLLATGVTAAGRPCLVMDYYPAGTLHDRLREHGPLPVDEVVTIGTVLADALAFAHDRGVLHRDVKPQNVLVLPTSWVLADFGIARLKDSEHTTSVETFTYRHAAPQILDGMVPTAADDIWSLGSTLFTLIDGRPPFASDDPDDDTALAYLRRARTEPHRRLHAPGAERVAAVIDRCLAKDVEQRWASAAELRDALASLRSTAWQPTGPPGWRTAPEQVSEPVAERVSEPVAERVSEPVAERVSEPVAERVSEPVAERASMPEPVSVSLPVPEQVPEPWPSGPEPPPAAVPEGDRSWAPDVTRRRPREASGAAPVEGGAPAAPMAFVAPPTAGEAPPDEIALSVLAHAPDVDTDGEPTGAALPDEGLPPGGQGRPPADVVPSPRRRGLLALGIVALTVGLVLGIGGAVLRGGADEPEASGRSSEPGGRPVGTLTAAPTMTGDPQVSKADPRLHFLIDDLKPTGAGVTFTWTDPTDGKGYFVLHQTVPKPSRPLATFDPGQTSTVWLVAAPPGTRFCFLMTVHLPTGELGLSNTRCVRV